MCSRLKRPARTVARDLYSSSRYLRDRAVAKATCDDWLVLSGKYGLVDPDCVIEPYDFDLNAASSLAKFFLCVRLWAQLLQRVGLTSPLLVELYAKGAYRECCAAALYGLGFRLYSATTQSGASAVFIRAKLVRSE
ncbi:DUF6884 domain-containing protein [Rhizobium leguminosarum]|uniref:DUF6884 domain-containing protein n=1 Tax=Rhizobium leguminosarum TaxID=384 RepID=UPI003D7C2293